MRLEKSYFYETRKRIKIEKIRKSETQNIQIIVISKEFQI